MDYFKIFLDFLKYLLEKKIKIIIFIFVGFILGIIYNKIQEEKYIAQTTFIVEEKSNQIGGLSSLASNFGLNLSNADINTNIFNGENILEILKSNYILDIVLKKKIEAEQKGDSTCLANKFYEIKKLKKKFKKFPISKNIDFLIENQYLDYKQNMVKDSLFNIIIGIIKKEYLNVYNLSRKTTIFKIDFEFSDRNFALKFLEILLEEVRKFYIDIKTETIVRNIKILEKKQEAVYHDLVDNIKIAAESESIFLNPASYENKVKVEESERRKNISLGIYLEITKNIEAARLTLIKYTPVIQVIDSSKSPLTVIKTRLLICLIIGGGATGFITCLVYLIKFLIKNKFFMQFSLHSS